MLASRSSRLSRPLSYTSNMKGVDVTFKTRWVPSSHQQELEEGTAMDIAKVENVIGQLQEGCAFLRLLQLFTEGHHLDMQNLVRTQVIQRRQ